MADPVSCPSSEEDQRNTRQVGDLAAGRLLGAVARRNMGDFMRHHSRQFRLVAGAQDKAGIDEQESARQGKGIDLIGIDYFDGKWHLGVGVVRQILSEPVNIFRDYRVVHDSGLALHLLGHLFAECDFLLDRVEIHTLSRIGVANIVGSFLLVAGQRCRSEQKYCEHNGKWTKHGHFPHSTLPVHGSTHHPL